MSQDRQTINILGLPVHALSIEEGVEAVIALSKQPKASYVAKPYVEFLVRAHEDPHILDLLKKADLVLPDGIALVWASHFLYGGPRTARRFFSTLLSIFLQPNSIKTHIPARFGGINFTWPLLEAAQREKLTLFLIGSPKHQDITSVARVIHAAMPAINLAGTFHGHIDETAEKKLLERLKASKPDLILVGTGFPRQEWLIQRLRPQLSRGVLIGEGGTFDYADFGGKLRKAPRPFQRLGLEWLWRLLLEPSRWRRQLAIPKFIWLIWRSR